MKITILTATYNREKLLNRLYESLNENYKTFKDFEWIIIDDGSSDNTKKVVEEWIKKAKYKIEYHYQKNAGKMSAINNGMKYVKGDIVTEIDSDDYLTKNALEIISKDYEKLDNENVYGILYKKKIIDKNTEIIDIDGKILKLFEVHNKYGYDFDMVITFKAKIRKKYKYELEHNERFVTEARTYYKIDQDYDGVLFLNKDILIIEYQEDGYTKNINKIFKNNPYGYYEYFKECLSYLNNRNCTFKRRLYFIRQYILFSYLTKKTKKESINNVKGFNKLLVIILIIPGYIKSKEWNK